MNEFEKGFTQLSDTNISYAGTCARAIPLEPQGNLLSHIDGGFLRWQ